MEVEAMSEKMVTIESLLFGSSGGAGAAALESLESEGQTMAVKDALAEAAKVPWESVVEEVGEQIGKLSDIGLDDILLRAWAKYRHLRQYRDAEKYPPDETILVPLAEHSVTSTHKPYVEILVGERRVGRITFEIQLKLDLEGVVLKVRDGKIWEVKSGRCRGEGRITVGAATLIEKETPLIDLPGVIKVPKGFEIPE